MAEDTDSTDTSNRRSVLKTVTAGAIGTTLLAGAGSANYTGDGVESQSGCVREWTEYRCVDANCSCACGDCDCDTLQQSRYCCEDSIGHILCGAWTSTGNCCESC